MNRDTLLPGKHAVAALALAALTSCSVLPTIVPDLEIRSSSPIRLEGARGPLTASQSKAVLVRLERNGEETSIFDRHLALEQNISGSPLVVGNKVVLLKDGPATFKAMFDAIAKAKSHIHMETYIIEDDEVGNQFADVLIDRSRQGIEVALVYDSVGSIGTPPEFFKRLKDGGVKVLEFNPVNPLGAKSGWQVNQRDHRKLLVVDGKVAFVGGINISSVYSSGSVGRDSKRRPAGTPPWRDTHLQMAGPVVAEFQKLFLATWSKQKGGALASRDPFPAMANTGTEVVRAIGSSSDEQAGLMYRTLMSAIESAETNVHLTVAYFVPDPQLRAALMAAAGRGVDVKLILPGHSDSWLVFQAGRGSYDELLAGGVKIYERRGALLHAKTALVDGVWSTIGSTNLDWRSFVHNDEINAVILGQEFAAQMQAMFEADLALSDPIGLAQWQARPIGDHVKEIAARVWGYWL